MCMCERCLRGYYSVFLSGQGHVKPQLHVNAVVLRAMVCLARKTVPAEIRFVVLVSEKHPVMFEFVIDGRVQHMGLVRPPGAQYLSGNNTQQGKRHDKVGEENSHNKEIVVSSCSCVNQRTRLWTKARLLSMPVRVINFGTQHLTGGPMAKPATSITDSLAAASVRRVTVQGAVGNLALTVLKGVVGFHSGSLALLADAAHSVSDLATDGVVLAGTWFGTRPPDDDHPYGHGRFETFATFIIAVVLMVVGLKLAWEAGYSLFMHEIFRPGPVVLVVALISVVVKEAMFRITRRVALATSTPAVMANAWHHRSDALSSVAVVLGALAGYVGLDHGDQVAGLVVGLMVGGVGANIALGCVREFGERGLSEAELQVVVQVMDADPDVLEWHRLRSRRAGRQIFVDVHVLVDPQLTVEEAHTISDRVERAVAGRSSVPISMTTHIEPYVDEHKESE